MYEDLFHIHDRISCLNIIRLPAASSVLVMTTLSFGVQVPNMNRAQPRQLRIAFIFSYLWQGDSQSPAGSELSPRWEFLCLCCLTKRFHLKIRAAFPCCLEIIKE